MAGRATDITVGIASRSRGTFALWAAALLAAAAAPAADTTWTRIKSANFELITSAGEKQGREAILYFERVQNVFGRMLKSQDLTPLPVRVVAFRSKKDFEQYRTGDFAAAYYLSSRDRDYIVMSGLGFENYPTALHEYTHLLVRHGHSKVPLWFNEGLAQLYSTLTPQGKRVMIGNLIPGCMAALEREKWIPLTRLVNVDPRAPEYTEKARASMFYAESWALAHMLGLQNNYREDLSRLAKAFGDGRTPEEAFQTADGLTLQQLDKILQAYVRGDRFNAGFFDVQFEKQQQELDATALTSYEGDLILTDLLVGVGKQEEAERMYEALARQQPNRPEAPQGLAYLAMHKGDRETALKHFDRAAALNSDSPRLYRDYAGLFESSGRRGEECQRALEKALALDPSSVETRMRLAQYFLRDRNFKQALVHYRQITVVSKEQANTYLEGLFLAYYRTGDKVGARVAADRLRELASTPDEILTAERMLKALAQPQPVEEFAASTEEPPVQRRMALHGKSTPESPAAPPHASDPGTPAATGTLDKFDCNTTPARLVIVVDGKPSEFVIDGAQGIVLRGFGAETVELECGPLKPALVSIQYRIDESASPPVKLVRAIELLKRP
jgi:tetratricopeptide (TPR) repeat protein